MWLKVWERKGVISTLFMFHADKFKRERHTKFQEEVGRNVFQCYSLTFERIQIIYLTTWKNESSFPNNISKTELKKHNGRKLRKR